MSTPAAVEVIWLPRSTHARAEPRLRVQPSGSSVGPQAEEAPVEYILAVCGGPRCGCTTIHLTSPAADGVEPQPRSLPSGVWLDLTTKSLIPGSDSKADAAFQRLDGMMRTQLTDADRQALREWFFAEKLELICTTPIEAIDIEGLPDARSGLMIGFVDVFPCGLDFNFTFQGERWAVDDQFCVQPGCSCSETSLTFLKLVDRAGVPATKIQDAPSLRYNHVTRKTADLSNRAADGPSPSDLLDAVKAAFPELNERLRLRQLMLQALYARQELDRNMSRIGALAGAGILGPKIGRNDPCPCGSGLKFKKCCLNRPMTAPESHQG